jgi:hypothetical protein
VLHYLLNQFNLNIWSILFFHSVLDILCSRNYTILLVKLTYSIRYVRYIGFQGFLLREELFDELWVLASLRYIAWYGLYASIMAFSNIRIELLFNDDLVTYGDYLIWLWRLTLTPLSRPNWNIRSIIVVKICWVYHSFVKVASEHLCREFVDSMNNINSILEIYVIRSNFGSLFSNIISQLWYLFAIL